MNCVDLMQLFFSCSGNWLTMTVLLLVKGGSSSIGSVRQSFFSWNRTRSSSCSSIVRPSAAGSLVHPLSTSVYALLNPPLNRGGGTNRSGGSAHSNYRHQRRNSGHRNALMRHPFWFLATSTALVSVSRWHGTLGDDPTAAEAAASAKADSRSDCPFYGCPLTPQDVHYNTERVKVALETLRQAPRSQGDKESQQLLATTGNTHSVTLTLIGYKGGPLQDQVNQDRALVVNPFFVGDSSTNNGRNVLVGVFDGHAPKGEDVSEFTKSELPVLLSKKLSKALTSKEEEVKKVLIETFVELDTRAPAEESGGCTATVVLKLDEKVYVANAGDSRSFLVSYRASTGETSVLYMSREDKPNLPDERARVEAMGGQVYIPIRGTSRVVYHDPRSGAPSGLAMSRSIGDWAAGKLGVIPHPIVDVFDMSDLVDALLVKPSNDGTLRKSPNRTVTALNSTVTTSTSAEATLDAGGNVMATKSDESVSTDTDDEDDVYIFAVCATDGMMDYLEAIDIATVLSKSLFDEKGAHPITAVEHLVFSAANAWQQDKLGRYRDDISIAVSTLRAPPPSKSRSHISSTSKVEGAAALPQ